MPYSQGSPLYIFFDLMGTEKPARRNARDWGEGTWSPPNKFCYEFGLSNDRISSRASPEDFP
jgi:hypothetical protein